MRISGKSTAQNLIDDIVRTWLNAKWEQYQIGEIWLFDSTDTELVGRN